MKYDIEVRHRSGWLMYSAELEWTTELPTVEGWYWAMPRPPWDVKGSQVVEVVFDAYDLEIRVPHLFYGSRQSLSEYTHWLGPIPVPELPTESE